MSFHHEMVVGLQDFSKDWAEQMIVSVVLVCSEPRALHILHSKQTCASLLWPPCTAAVTLNVTW